MNLKHINVGIIHSLIGKNDGVSIVIDQTVNAMVNNMNIALGNIYFLGAHSSPRFNAETDDVFWHKSDAHTFSAPINVEINTAGTTIRMLLKKNGAKPWHSLPVQALPHALTHA